MAFRYRLLPDGKRQILTFIIHGDIFGLHAFFVRAMDHSIGTLVPTRLATISRATMFDLFEHHPRIGAALWWSTLQEEAILRERIVALGRRSARGRVVYLLCELVWRQKAVRLAEDHAIRLPLKRIELADALGPTPVHLNRIVQGLRRDSLIALAHSRLTLLDVERLQDIAGFDQDYLHFGGAPTEIRSYLDTLERSRGTSASRRTRPGREKIARGCRRFRDSDHDPADPVELRPPKSRREPPDRADPRTLEHSRRPRLSAGTEVTSSNPLSAKVCAIASMSCAAERPAERYWPISSCSRASSTTPLMASSAFSFEMTPSSTRMCKMLSHNIRLTWASGSGTGITPSSVIGVRSPSRMRRPGSERTRPGY
jgi:CRP-like cAMP-binding protein